MICNALAPVSVMQSGPYFGAKYTCRCVLAKDHNTPHESDFLTVFGVDDKGKPCEYTIKLTWNPQSLPDSLDKYPDKGDALLEIR